MSEEWDKLGPKLLDALERMVKLNRPCSKPTGAPGSDMRITYNAQVEAYNNAIRVMSGMKDN